MLKKGVYVVGFFYPVVPKDQARIRVQLSASHKINEIDLALDAFHSVGKDLGIYIAISYISTFRATFFS